MEQGKRQRPFNDIQKSLFYAFFFWGYCLFRKIETLLHFLEFCMETPTFPFLLILYMYVLICKSRDMEIK